MATGWVKSFQCKSRATDDVVLHHRYPNSRHHHVHQLITTASNCSKGAQNLKDVIDTAKPKPRPKKPKPPPSSPPKLARRKSDVGSNRPATRVRSSASTRHSEPLLPALTELPEGHPSRNVVEIIFHTGWSPKSFSGRVEMIFKVQNLPRTVTRFEEYREVVKSRVTSVGGGGAAVDGSSEDFVRCLADGNEMMRFHCLGPATGGVQEHGGGGAWSTRGGKGAAVCTFSGSGEAHENAGGGKGRRAMLVCRVIAGRVGKKIGFDSVLEGRVGSDSVSGDNGKLIVFDSRAVLPCFLIIYNKL